MGLEPNKEYRIRGFYNHPKDEEEKTTVVPIVGLSNAESKERLGEIDIRNAGTDPHLRFSETAKPEGRVTNPPILASSGSLRSIAQDAKDWDNLEKNIYKGLKLVSGRGLMAPGKSVEEAGKLNKAKLGPTMLTDTMIIRYFSLAGLESVSDR